MAVVVVVFEGLYLIGKDMFVVKQTKVYDRRYIPRLHQVGIGGDEEMGFALDTYLVQTDPRRCRDGAISSLGRK